MYPFVKVYIQQGSGRDRQLILYVDKRREVEDVLLFLRRKLLRDGYILLDDYLAGLHGANSNEKKEFVVRAFGMTLRIIVATDIFRMVSTHSCE